MTGVHDRMIKQAIYPYHFLTAKQITRLLYPTPKLGNLTTVQAKLKDLTTHKYLHSFYLPLPQRQQPYVYCLGIQGKKYLKAEGMDTDVYYLPSEQEEKAYGWLIHVLELNDFLIGAKLLERRIPSLHQFDMQHDLLLKRRPVCVTDTQGTVHDLVPDGLLDLRVERPGKRTRRHFLWVELDRDNHSNEKFREKLRTILLFVEHGCHTTYFGKEEPIPVVFVTTAGERRVEKMRELARMEVKASVKSSKNLMFKFASVPPLMREPFDPETLFCSPLWLSPYGDEQATLIDLTR